MKLSDALQNLVLLLLVLGAGALLFGQAAGQPVLLGYVETGSMEPTLEPGDGFIAVPAALTPPPEEGDVVVFDAQELQGGGLTTHRVVGETEEGYITRGDANPFTDQESVEPPVPESRIVAEALQVNGQVVVIPNLGTGVLAIQGVATGAIGVVMSTLNLGALLQGAGPAQSLVWVGIGLIVVSLVTGSAGSDRRTSRSRSRKDYVRTSTFLLVIVLIVVAPATASMVVASGTTSFDIVSSQSPNDNPLVVGAGAETTIEYRVINDGFVPTLTVVEPQHPDLSVSQSVFVVPARSERTTTLRIRAPEETGAYSRAIGEWRYIPVLPRSVILSLHAVHPYVAIAAIDLFLAGVAVTLGLLSVGAGPIRLRSTGRNITMVQRFKRRFL
ncbi:signal peptidase I [Halobaculum roseum]|uniref:Signal peptidase I n=1 Tax=Halobaculum roseum TaxID=2175149 RepID=A0ABD5MLI7_9EURY|nr:signal peptidase I [Halobaculum roseum]QZY03122.1 signal peptidase I [Halobaculum roseum]